MLNPNEKEEYFYNRIGLLLEAKTASSAVGKRV